MSYTKHIEGVYSLTGYHLMFLFFGAVALISLVAAFFYRKLFLELST
jgi:hypothetical protein